jgi:uncharacterized protein with PIN domain
VGERPASAPPLLLDAMLGRLARWLRLMGYDAAFLADTPDIDLVRLARAESRLLLTRDRELAARRGVQALFIESQDFEAQLAQVQQEVGPPPEPVVPRCGVCNTPLKPLSKQAARERVPPYVWRTQEHFTYCEGCHRVYWQGTHWEGIQEQLGEHDGPSGQA